MTSGGLYSHAAHCLDCCLCGIARRSFTQAMLRRRKTWRQSQGSWNSRRGSWSACLGLLLLPTLVSGHPVQCKTFRNRGVL